MQHSATTSDETGVRAATTGDAASIAAIYNEHVRGTVATFELEPLDAGTMAQRIADVQARGLPWLVLDLGAGCVGYACATAWKPRAAYARTVETSIYLDASVRGRGLGRRLYAALLARLRAGDLHVAIGGIALPNAASIALHEGLGFVPAGCFREVGFKLGRWVDVGYWQLQLTPAA